MDCSHPFSVASGFYNHRHCHQPPYPHYERARSPHMVPTIGSYPRRYSACRDGSHPCSRSPSNSFRPDLSATGHKWHAVGYPPPQAICVSVYCHIIYCGRQSTHLSVYVDVSVGVKREEDRQTSFQYHILFKHSTSNLRYSRLMPPFPPPLPSSRQLQRLGSCSPMSPV